jgi:SAM-dependent methyltransferase
MDTPNDARPGAAHDLGAQGFAQGALYDAARPRYPDEAVALVVERFALDQRSRVLDLGAGTGIFSRQVRPFVGALTAVEPSASMRETLTLTTADVEVLDGSDVAIPTPDAQFEAVVVAQAFHWFDAPRALIEIHRVLVPGGGLALLWNERDTRVAWIRDFDHAMLWDEFQPFDSRVDYGAVVADGPFDDVERRSCRHRQRLTHDQVRQRVASTSYVTLMGEDERSGLLARVTRVLEGQPDPVEMPYVTDVITAVARQ